MVTSAIQALRSRAHASRRRRSALPLAWFRIAFACVLAYDVGCLLKHAPFWFDPIPRTESLPWVRPVLALWLFVIIAIAVGYRTRWFALVNYAFAVVNFGVLGMPLGYEYHPDGLFLLGSIGLLFLPVSEHLSLDARRRTRPARGVRNAEWLFVVFLSAGIYLDSALWKLSSEAWWNGLGFWLPAVWPTDAPEVVDWTYEAQPFARALGYIVMGYELAFPFLIWFRGLRRPLIAAGLVLHFGIAVVIPLPIFGALMIAFLLALVPVDGEPRTPPLKSPRVARVAAVLVLGAFAVALVEPLRALGHSGLGAERSPQDATLEPGPLWRQRTSAWSYRFLGIRTHPIFLDSAFADSTVERRLVVVDRDGHARPIGPVRRDRHFTWWAFRATWPKLDAAAIESKLTRFVQAYAPRPLPTDAHLELRSRRLELPIDGWRAGQRSHNLQQPWHTEASIRFDGAGVAFDWAQPQSQ